MAEDELYRAAYNAARVTFEQRGGDKDIAQPFAVDAARAAASSMIESTVLRAVDAARKDAAEPTKINAVSTCPICGGPAASFAYRGAWAAACQSCRQAWRLRTNSTISTSLAHDRAIEEKLDGFLWLDTALDAV